jgi:hypothetical protein
MAAGPPAEAEPSFADGIGHMHWSIPHCSLDMAGRRGDLPAPTSWDGPLLGAGLTGSTRVLASSDQLAMLCQW